VEIEFPANSLSWSDSGVIYEQKAKLECFLIELHKTETKQKGTLGYPQPPYGSQEKGFAAQTMRLSSIQIHYFLPL
jgi:hypothetical protein